LAQDRHGYELSDWSLTTVFKDQHPNLHRVPALAGLKISESKLLSGKRAEAAHPSPRQPERHNEARQRVHASAFSEILRRVPGRKLTDQLSL
jgi:hypothetical protein